MTRHERIKQILSDALKPSFLEIENESPKHNVPLGSETHFKLIIVAEAFQPLERLDRHRQLNALLANELKTGLHALSLHLYSPTEWNEKKDNMLKSPPCRGGHHHD